MTAVTSSNHASIALLSGPSADSACDPRSRTPRRDLLAALPDDELHERVHQLAAKERSATADLVAHLAEIELRRLYLSLGCSSMFAYCTELLHLSESAAYARIEVARAVRRFPLLLQQLEDGALSLTSIRRLSPVLNPENFDRLVAAARHRTARAVDELVARERPKPDAAPMIRRLPRPSEHVSRRVEHGLLGRLEPSPSSEVTTPNRAVDRVRGSIQPLAPERFHVQFTAGREMRDRIDRARDLLRHRLPNGDLASVIDAALIELLTKLERQKCGALARPGVQRSAGRVRAVAAAPIAGTATPPMTETTPHPATPVMTVTQERPPFARPNRTRTIPRAVRRAVARRDAARCSFVSRCGRRCSATAFLEFHHVDPFARGDEATVANLELRCRAHNAYEADSIGLGRRGV